MEGYIEIKMEEGDFVTLNFVPGTCEKIQVGDKILINNSSDGGIPSFIAEGSIAMIKNNAHHYFKNQDKIFILITEKIWANNHIEFHGKKVPNDGEFYE